MALPILGVAIGAVIEGITSWWRTRQEIKKVEAESAIEIKKAETQSYIRRLETQQQLDAEWEIKSIANNGWKDEYLTLVMSIPLIMCFVPGLDDYVHRGFASLGGTPDWYQYALLVVLASAFGFRKITDLVGTLKK
jgi:hypothetical protein